jgi:hypothetical protein
MLHFMNHFNYDAGGGDQAPVSPMTFNVKMYSVADKYDVPALKSQAREEFENASAVRLLPGVLLPGVLLSAFFQHVVPPRPRRPVQ